MTKTIYKDYSQAKKEKKEMSFKIYISKLTEGFVRFLAFIIEMEHRILPYQHNL